MKHKFTVEGFGVDLEIWVMEDDPYMDRDCRGPSLSIDSNVVVTDETGKELERFPTNELESEIHWRTGKRPFGCTILEKTDVEVRTYYERGTWFSFELEEGYDKDDIEFIYETMDEIGHDVCIIQGVRYKGKEIESDWEIYQTKDLGGGTKDRFLTNTSGVKPF